MNKAEEKQIKIYKKMSADKKITLLDDFFTFAKELKHDHKKTSHQYQPSARRA